MAFGNSLEGSDDMVSEINMVLLIIFIITMPVLTHAVNCARCDRTLEFHDADLQAHARRIALDAGCADLATPQITVYAACLGCGRDPSTTANTVTSTP
jgi:Fe2+ or Zn2+ uptake regulation protein